MLNTVTFVKSCNQNSWINYENLDGIDLLEIEWISETTQIYILITDSVWNELFILNEKKKAELLGTAPIIV